MRSLSLFARLAFLYLSALAAPDADNVQPGGQAPEYFNSDLIEGGDPYAFYDTNTSQYYLYSTLAAEPGYIFGLYSSPDLVTWHRPVGGAMKSCYDAQMNRIEGGQMCWARDWNWAPETYYNDKTGWYFMFFAGRLLVNMTGDYFRYSAYEEPSKIGVAVSRSPTGPFKEIEPKPIDYFPFDPNYHDVNLIMDDKQMLPPKSQSEGETAPKGTYIPGIDPNILFDKDGHIYLYTSRNAYRNWNWDDKLGKYIEESNIVMVELERDWWDDVHATTMPQIVASQKNANAKDASPLPHNITSYNGTGEIGYPPRKDGWTTIISYGADPQDWENYQVNDYETSNGTLKDRRWAEGPTVITRPGPDGKPVYLITYSANNVAGPYYGVGFATANSPFGPFRKSTLNPILFMKPDGEYPIYTTAHGCIIPSPPPNSWDRIGAQEIMTQTPEGSELFYIHGSRNTTTGDRWLYTTRLTLKESAVHFESNDALSMHLTPLDQPLPLNTYPVNMEVQCSRNWSGQQFEVRVKSKSGAPFDLTEGSNRVVALPGYEEAISSVDESGSQEGTYTVKFDDNNVKELAYQRLGRDGNWSTITSKVVFCI